MLKERLFQREVGSEASPRAAGKWSSQEEGPFFLEEQKNKSHAVILKRQGSSRSLKLPWGIGVPSLHAPVGRTHPEMHVNDRYQNPFLELPNVMVVCAWERGHRKAMSGKRIWLI